MKTRFRPILAHRAYFRKVGLNPKPRNPITHAPLGALEFPSIDIKSVSGGKIYS